MAIKVITWATTLLGVFSLVISLAPEGKRISVTSTVLLTLVSIFFLVLIIWDVISYIKSKSKVFPRSAQKRIKKYMKNWISEGGRTAIFTRDMSWTNPEIEKILIEKAKANELVIIAPKKKESFSDYEKAGADVIVFEDLDIEPQSRFTIIDYGSMNARVAVGHTFRKKHRIQEYSNGEHPAFFMANDLANIVERYHRHE